MKYSFRFIVSLTAGLYLLGLSSCSTSRYNSDYNLNRALQKENAKNNTVAMADTARPELVKPAEEVKEEEKKKKRKPSKRYFMGYKVSRGFVKSGGKGERQLVETFSYLPAYEAPNPYSPEKYYFDVKKEKVYKTSGEVDPAKYKVLHGPYKRRQGKQVVEEGYFYVGTKHLRWERYRNDENHTLIDKRHFEKGLQRDAEITYWEGTKNIKEVIPHEYGQVQGMYYRFYENGQLEWSGQYEKGRKVGIWIKHYNFRNRRHYEFQYPKTAYDAPAEPELVKEYDRHGTTIFEKGKLDKRSAQR